MINLYFEILRWSVDPTIISKQKDTGKLNYSLLYLLYLFLNTFLTDTIFLSVLIYLIINSFYNKENDKIQYQSRRFSSILPSNDTNR